MRWSPGQTQRRRKEPGTRLPCLSPRRSGISQPSPEPSVALMGIQQTVALQIKVPLLADSDLGHSSAAGTPHPHCPAQ